MMPRSGRRSGAATGGVQSVHRALDLLEVVAARGGSLTHRRDRRAPPDIPLPTAHRLLRTLVDRGYMRQDRRPSLRARLPAGAAGRRRRLRWPAPGPSGCSAALVDALGETANLAVLDGDQVAYVAQVPGRHAMRMFTEVGRRVQPHCTAVGKALLADRSDEARSAALLGRTGLAPAHRRTPSPTPRRSLAAARRTSGERGYALDEGEQEVGVRCVAVAVPRAHRCRWPSRSPGPPPG